MLIIQSLDTYYDKKERSSEYARLRTGDMFRKIDPGRIKECEVFVQRVSLRYDADKDASPAQQYHETYQEYGQNIFTEGTKKWYGNYNQLLKFMALQG